MTKYAPKEGKAGGEIVPGLAEPAEGHQRRQDLHVHAQKGVKFSDGTPVKASDYEHAIKRMVGLKGPYSSFFTGIAGAEEFQEGPEARQTSRASRPTTRRARSP